MPAQDNKEGTMKMIEIDCDWVKSMGKLKQKWGELTDDDLRYVEGGGIELFNRIQQRTGKTREGIEGAFREIFSRF